MMRLPKLTLFDVEVAIVGNAVTAGAASSLWTAARRVESG